jgi:hypothetical protein
MNSTFPPTSPHMTLYGECLTMFPQTPTLPLELEVIPPLSMLPLTPKVALHHSLVVNQSLLPMDVVQPPLLGSITIVVHDH